MGCIRIVHSYSMVRYIELSVQVLHWRGNKKDQWRELLSHCGVLKDHWRVCLSYCAVLKDQWRECLSHWAVLCTM